MIRSIPPYASDDYPTPITEEAITESEESEESEENGYASATAGEYYNQLESNRRAETATPAESYNPQIPDYSNPSSVQSSHEEAANTFNAVNSKSTITPENNNIIDAYMSGNVTNIQKEHSGIYNSGETKPNSTPKLNTASTTESNNGTPQVSSEETSRSVKTNSTQIEINTKLDCQFLLTDLGFPFGVVMWGRESILQYAIAHKITFTNKFQEIFDRYYPKI